MAHEEPDRTLPGHTIISSVQVQLGDQKTIKQAHQSNSHGDVLILDFHDGTQLMVWAFDRPDNQQIVLWKPQTEQLILDLRSDDCKDFTDRVWAGLAKRLPHLYGPGGKERKPLFKVYHHKWPIPDEVD